MKAPLPVTFSSAGSVDNDGAIVAYAWDFTDDGSVDSTDANPSFTYTTDGLKVARLTVTDTDGATGTTTVQVNVGPENVAPVAVPTADTTSGKRNLAVQFSSASSTDSDGTIVEYLWDFGDGSPTSDVANPSHTYTVGDVDRDPDRDRRRGPDPHRADHDQLQRAPGSRRRCDCHAQLGQAAAGGPVLLGDLDRPRRLDRRLGMGLPERRRGRLDLGQPDPRPTPQGTYTARLTVTDEEGLTSSTTVNVASNANQAPVAVANSDRTVGKGPLVVQFTLDRLAGPRRLDRRLQLGLR